MSRQGKSPEEVAAELRELLREARGMLGDLQRETKAARAAGADIVDEHVMPKMTEFLDSLGTHTLKSIKEIEESVFARFDKLMDVLTGAGTRPDWAAEGVRLDDVIKATGRVNDLIATLNDERPIGLILTRKEAIAMRSALAILGTSVVHSVESPEEERLVRRWEALGDTISGLLGQDATQVRQKLAAAVKEYVPPDPTLPRRSVDLAGEDWQ